MNLPDYLIIGEVKCGTTSFYNYLIQHPQILDTFGNGDRVDNSYVTKEIRFFDRYFNKGLRWYKSCFPATKNGEITGEGTPMYMYRTLALTRIHRLLPKAKFIVLLRNPVDRLYSHFNHYKKWVPGWIDKYNSFEGFLDSAHEVDYYMIDKGIYVTSLSRWFRLFSKEQFLIIKTEDLHVKAQETYSTALKFLGVSDYKLNQFKHFRKLQSPPILPETKSLLKEFYRPYNEELYELIGRDMGWEKDA